MNRLACCFALALLAPAAGCHEAGGANLELTVDGEPFPSTRGAASLYDAGNPDERQIWMCSYASTGENICEVFVVARAFHEGLVTPVTLRVLGTARTADVPVEDPRSNRVQWTYAADAGHAPEILRAFAEHHPSSTTWDVVQVQRLDGTLVIERVSDEEYSGRIDLAVVGALPPIDLDVDRQAHVTGSFIARALP